MDILYFFIQSIPESMGLVAMSLALGRVSQKWGHIFIGGALIAVIAYIVRSLQGTFGFHLPVMIFVLFILLVKFTTLKPSRAIIAVFTSFFTLALLEYLVSGAFFAYSHMDPQQVLADLPLWTALGIVQAVLLNVIAVILARFLKPSKGAWK
jgi:hypothetical protein